MIRKEKKELIQPGIQSELAKELPISTHKAIETSALETLNNPIDTSQPPVILEDNKKLIKTDTIVNTEHKDIPKEPPKEIVINIKEDEKLLGQKQRNIESLLNNRNSIESISSMPINIDTNFIPPPKLRNKSLVHLENDLLEKISLEIINHDTQPKDNIESEVDKNKEEIKNNKENSEEIKIEKEEIISSLDISMENNSEHTIEINSTVKPINNISTNYLNDKDIINLPTNIKEETKDIMQISILSILIDIIDRKISMESDMKNSIKSNEMIDGNYVRLSSTIPINNIKDSINYIIEDNSAERCMKDVNFILNSTVHRVT